jgi:hypothetical protein
MKRNEKKDRKMILIYLRLFSLGSGITVTLTPPVCEVAILVLTADIPEDLNLHYPKMLLQSGSVVTLIALPYVDSHITFISS